MDKLIFGTGASSEKETIRFLEIIKTVIGCGILSFDTAPSYGTEKNVGRVIEIANAHFGIGREKICIQTKIDPLQMISGKDGIKNHIKSVLKDMNIEYIDSLLIHWPLPEFLYETWDTMKELKEEGMVKRIGICNLRERQIKQYINELDASAIPDIIQIERHPLNTCEREVELCTEKGIEIQAYSPLCKMHKSLKNSMVLHEIADKYSKGIGEIILRWHLDTGVIPVFTSKNIERIKQYASVLRFKLDQTDIAFISDMNRDYKMFLEAWLCPGF